MRKIAKQQANAKGKGEANMREQIWHRCNQRTGWAYVFSKPSSRLVPLLPLFPIISTASGPT